ncbi:Sgf11 (transcriptional regulation protein) protein [Citrus sinensis]|uniref:Sgf11 (Transcriptional regulation protein) protein n=1 Tax=Citrus sinensis TaxID=2711 RepID=A0ACB8I8G7_CITSI|nr:Sgf11 (transcriptional regulation protein) protein [Citrus sinensis]
MVCSSGSRRLAVMARLLDAGSFVSQIGADEVSYHKLAAQNIYRELSEADEANLLDEEDMHIFGSKPMADPLHLVSCNACKKPIKASQYAAHAELCRSLNATGEYILDVHGGTGHRKPPRKERKKLLTAYINQATPVTDQERSESLDVGDNSSVSVDVKRNSACVNIASAVDGSGVSSENTDHSACVMPPPTKRSKLIAGEHLPLPGDQPTASGITKTLSSQDAHNCTDFPEQTIPGSVMPSDSVVPKNPEKIHVQQCCLHEQDVPAPLATKIYYSQRNNRLKSVLTRQFYGASVKELDKDVVIPDVPNNNTMSLEALSHGGSSREQVNDLLHKKLKSSVQTPDQILAQNSEMYLGKSRGYLPTTNFSNQFQADNVPRSQSSTVGLTSKYLPKAYSFAGNSGKLLGTMQQPNGRVPVV